MLPISIDEIPDEIKNYLSTIHSIRFPTQGYTSDVGIIESNKGCFALKRAKGEQFTRWLHRERMVLNGLAQTSLPIPTVILFIELTAQKESWLLIDFLEGETLRMALSKEKNKEKREEMIFNFGKLLYQIHATPCPEELKYEKSWLEEMLIQAAFNLEYYQVDGTQDILKYIKTTIPPDVKPTLIHGDFTIDNVLVCNGMVTGVIDWSGGAHGDPRYDLSLAIRPKPNAFESERDKQIFFEGYRGKMIDHDVYDYFVNGLYEFF
ncbi:aminoglycoside phosphotransferase family protein [Peribacillus sp. FSL H8-0477]|uniref:phosphotransferase family protein n=1 Tax=Peribacillus sp. FSL H8-0477 TaxID=2921388 RepID=UPI0030FBB61B